MTPHPETEELSSRLQDSLSKSVGRLKARWFDRVKRHPDLTGTSKCIAHSIANGLNCVTLDCWLSQQSFANSIGGCSTKTVQRALNELEEYEAITVRRFRKIKIPNRCAPNFLPVDMDKLVSKFGQSCPPVADTHVHQSYLSIQSESSSTVSPVIGSKIVLFVGSYNRKERGVIEAAVIKRLGDDGLDILSQLSLLDDRIIDRLCRAQLNGALTTRDLEAARLAAKQAKFDRSGF
jgi:Helix-turn-helix domain